MTITLKQYVGRWADSPDWTDARIKNAMRLLVEVNLLLAEIAANGVALADNPKTACLISGEQFGGFRPQACKQGASTSSHKEGRGVDVYDPENKIDDYISQFDRNNGMGNELLERFGLYREAPSATLAWCHLTDRPPPSKRRTFYP